MTIIEAMLLLHVEGIPQPLWRRWFSSPTGFGAARDHTFALPRYTRRESPWNGQRWMDAIDCEPTVTAMPTIGGAADYDALFGAAYSVLRGVARAQRARWCGAATLCTTALVHEAYLRLSPGESPQWQDRGHFFRVAARAMRHILIDYAERRRAIKRGGGGVQLPIDEAPLVDESRIEDLLALDEALKQLERRSPRQAQIVECRVFAGLDVVETAQALAMSTTTVKREWRRGQAWLYRRLESPGHVGIAVRGEDEEA